MLLALDTSTLTCGIALYDDPVVVGEMMWRTASHHTVELAPAVAELLRRCSVAPTDLKCVAVALGPGSFTSLRISLAFATDSWAEIYDGSGKAVLYDLGRAGTQRTIAAAAPLSVTFGNASAVTLTVNGRPAVIPVVPGDGTVAQFKIEADGNVR